MMSMMLKFAHGKNGENPGTTSFKGKSIFLNTSWMILCPLNIVGLANTQKTSNIKNPSKMRNAGYKALNLNIFTIAQATQIPNILLTVQCLRKYHNVTSRTERNNEIVALRLNPSQKHG
mmetsp:Transcript_16240/g.15961  ORF Transcript_16240/g.15961 Transcript_16240/m.15961 type:complete len:119 (-) Transcript_16240:529-885(-)